MQIPQWFFDWIVAGAAILAAYLKYRSAKKEALSLEETVKSVIQGVERFSEEKPSNAEVKKIVQEAAEELGVESKLKSLVDKFTK